jgi:hypothetical protein
MYIELEAGAEIKSQALGANYISKESQEFYSETKPFSPIESCKKFGGDNCEELYPQSSIDGRCVNSVNKSLYPESYPQVPGLSESSVPIDRPLGTFGDYKPSSQLVPTTSFAEPPSYYELLPGDATPGARSEPILSATIRDPLVPDSGAGSLSEYYNSEFGIVEFVRAKLEKSREFNCATFDSPYYYQACMNLMKCKKFSIPTSGKYFLDFCPKTFSGGRLKK